MDLHEYYRQMKVKELKAKWCDNCKDKECNLNCGIYNALKHIEEGDDE